jgi:hypothetical protein
VSMGNIIYLWLWVGWPILNITWTMRQSTFNLPFCILNVSIKKKSVKNPLLNLPLKDGIWIFSMRVRQLKKVLAKEEIKILTIYRSSKHTPMLYNPSKQQCHQIQHTIRIENTYLVINSIY